MNRSLRMIEQKLERNLPRQWDRSHSFLFNDFKLADIKDLGRYPKVQHKGIKHSSTQYLIF